jgi:hypothetical protein
MNFKKVILIAAISLIALSGFSQEAGIAKKTNRRFSVELGGGSSFAIGKPAGFKLSSGMGSDGVIGYTAYKNFGLFAGWGFNMFESDYFDFEETGYMYGIQYRNSFKESKFSYTLRVGALYNHIEVEGAHDSYFDGFYSDSGHGLGFHTSASLQYSLGKGWAINGNVKFHQLKRDVQLEESELLPEPYQTDYSFNLKYIGLRIGIVKNF